MSGGSYDYAYRNVVNFASDLRCGEHKRCADFAKHTWNDECAQCEHSDEPGCDADGELRLKFREHLRKVADAMKAIEWNDSGDGARDEAALIKACLGGTDAKPE